jgi:hypothetical protein
MPENKAKFVGQTLAVWQPRSTRELTIEDGREIAENVTGFFRILSEWDAADQRTSTKVKVLSESSSSNTTRRLS